MSRGRIFFRVVLGGYLAYLGFSLVRDGIADKPNHYIWFVLVGVVFLVLGLAWAAMALKIYFTEGAAEPAEELTEELTEEENEEKTEEKTEEKPEEDAADEEEKKEE